MRSMFVGLRGALVVLAALVLSACPGPSATLEILEPMDGAELTLATDVDSAMPGVQTRVVVRAVGVPAGESVVLLLDDSLIVGSQVAPPDGMIIYEGVTIPSGRHDLEALLDLGDVRSERITIDVADECFAVNFVTPTPSPSPVTLGPGDDTDGVACGDTFEATVVVSTAAPDGSEARIFVNGTPRRTARVTAGAVRFEGIAFDYRDTDPNTLSVEVTSLEGITCGSEFSSPILVDCAGVSCVITSPASASAFLNQDDDVSAAAGFQGDFSVTTDAEGAAQAIRLIVDGNESGARSAIPDGMVATFGNVSLSEGVHRAQAECRDSSGNVTRSGVSEWTIDNVACDVAITLPTDGALFVPGDDLDGALAGIQIDVTGTSGGDCLDLRVGPCSAIDAMPFGPASLVWTERATLSSSATQQLCAQREDAAGNIGTAMVDVRVRTDEPQLEFVTPATGTAYNIEGTGGRERDLTPGNSTCEAAFDVLCTDVGVDVQLVRVATSMTLARTACVATGGLPSPYNGRAVFASVSLPSLNDGTSFQLQAIQDIGPVIGRSNPIALTSDCSAPALSITRPTCGATLRPADDEDGGLAGIQYRTVVQNPTDPSADVTLTIRPAGGGAAIYTETSTLNQTTVSFASATYGGGGMLEIVPTATDNAGNLGSTICAVTVENLPTLTITQPSNGAALGAANDCSGAAGMQVQVAATTDAVDGSSASVTIGTNPAVTATVSGGTVTVCADAPEGRSVAINVSVTDTRGTAMASSTVTIDSAPPIDAISDLMGSVLDRRRGIVRFTWTAVNDAGGFTLSSYALRCDDQPITNETEWAAAETMTVFDTPSSAETIESDDVEGFRVGATAHCAMRARDPSGELTPLAPSVATTLSFLQHEVSRQAASTAVAFGSRVVPVGDVNGDAIDDVLIASTDEIAVYFGSTLGLASAPSVRLIGASGSAFGQGLAGIGDFNGDGLPDFVVTAPFAAGFAGAAFVFFGRGSATPWPAAIDLSSGGCAADICYVGDDGAAGGPDGLAFLGWSAGPAGDFDGDGFMDLALGASNADSGAGRAYILLGNSTFPASPIAVPGLAGAEPNGFYVAGGGSGGNAWAQIGQSITSIGGDLNGGGDDVLVGAAGSGTVAASAGLLFGRAHPGGGLVAIANTELTRLETGAANVYGVSVHALGDINGDTRLDAGVYDAASGGSLRVFLGTVTGLSTTRSFVITNDLASASSDNFGLSVGVGQHPSMSAERIGDIDRDGVADVLVGSRERGTANATVEFFYDAVRDPLAPGAALLRSRASASFGPAAGAIPPAGTLAAAYIGDVNGDGFNDIALGDSSGNGGAGRMLIIY